MSDVKTTCCECNEPFVWDDTVVLVNDNPYHNTCVTLYPAAYYAVIDGEYIGTTDNEKGDSAYELIPGLLTDEDEE